MQHRDETAEFWRQHSHDHLAEIAAELHRQRRVWHGESLEQEVQVARRALAAAFIRGSGVEVGAGSRPWPLPEGASCFYGDVRDGEALRAYFGGRESAFQGMLDAQTFEGVPDASLDFVISAHVIEHLEDPIGSIRQAMRVLRPGGVFLVAVPDMRHTWDKDRPVTTLGHLIADEQDGGAGTRLQSYMEHVTYLHPQWAAPIPDAQKETFARKMAEDRADTHFHTWTTDTFREMLDYVAQRTPFEIVAHFFGVNENIFALRKAA